MGPSIYRFGDFELDEANRELSRAGTPIAISARAFDILSLLVSNSGKLVTKDAILQKVWSGQIVEESNLTVQISQIRRILGENSKAPGMIETVPGFGYRFNSSESTATVEVVERITIAHEDETESALHGRLPAIGAAAGILVLLAVGYYFLAGRGELSKPTVGVRQTRLTNNGRVSRSALSPDGKLLAYVTNEQDGNSLWIRQVGVANDRRIIPPTNDEFWGLTFDPKGSEIYYTLFSSDRVDPRLFHVPALGGVAEFIPDVFAHSITFAPDGNRFAYVLPNSAANENHLIVQNRDGTGKRSIAVKPVPSTFVYDGAFVAWSPDGSSIAVLVNNFDESSNFNTVVLVDPETGSEKPLGTDKWYNVNSLVWATDGSDLLLSASDSPSSDSRVWLIPRSGNAPRPVTNDLLVYSSLSPAGKNGSFVARQTASVSGISVLKKGAEVREIVSEVGSTAPIRWTASGRLIFRSAADGNPNLWTVDPDGSNRRQLTTGANVDERGMCVTADGQYVVFVSWRSGKSNLWRVGVDGANLLRLTDGDADAYPNCSADGSNVIFQRGLLAKPTLWRVSSDGANAVPIVDHRAKWGALSNDGSKFSFFRMIEEKWSIGIASIANPTAVNNLAVPEILKRDRVVWGQSDNELYFIGSENGAQDGIWKLGINGGGLERLAAVPGGSIVDFDINRDGEIVVATARVVSDVVEISIGDDPRSVSNR